MGFRYTDSSTGGGLRSTGSPARLRPAIALPALKDPETQPVRRAAHAANRAEAACLDAALDYADTCLAHVEAETQESRAAAAAGESVVLRDPALERSAMCMYLAQALGMSENQVSMMVEEGRFAREHCPATWAGFHEGLVGMRHVMRIVDAARRLEDPTRIPDLDRQAVAYAAGHRMGQLSAWLRRWIAAAEPQEHAARCAEKVKGRRVWVEPGEEGTSLLCAELPTMTAERIGRRLRAVAVSAEQPVPRNPEVDAMESCTPGSRPGDPTERPVHTASDPVDHDAGQGTAAPALPQTRAEGDERTLAQREADMLSAWLLNGQTEAGIPIDAHIGVLISADSLTGASQQPGMTRDRKTPISAAAIRGIAHDPSSEIRWHEVHHRPPHAHTPFPALEQNILAHVYTGRFVPRVLREAVSFRDGVCTAEGCGTPAENCDMDHVVPWPAGQTIGDNIEPLCRRHHRLKTAGHHVTADHGTPEPCSDAVTAAYDRAA